MTAGTPGGGAGADVRTVLARGGIFSVPFPAPDAWPHGPLPNGEKELVVGADRLSAGYCTCEGHRFLRAHLLLPIIDARTVLGFETWASVSEESWQAWLAVRAQGGESSGAFAWLANRLPGFDDPAPVPCNLIAGPPGALPRLQPHPGRILAEAQSGGISHDRFREICIAANVAVAF